MFVYELNGCGFESRCSHLNAYGFDKNSLKIMRNYLSNCWQRTNISTTFKSWSALLKGVPQGSVLGPALFNIFLNELFCILKDTDVCNFADDTSPHACDIDLNELLMCLEHDSALAVCWIVSNYMKMNSDIFRSFGRLVYWFGCPNTGTQKALIKLSFFSRISTKITLK